MDPRTQTYVPFTFTNLTNTNLTAHSLKSRLIDQKIKHTALQRQLQRARVTEPNPIEPSQIVKDFGESLLRGRLVGVGEPSQGSVEWRSAPKERILRKVNCAYFRGKKAVFKSSNVRISFEITDKL